MDKAKSKSVVASMEKAIAEAGGDVLRIPLSEAVEADARAQAWDEALRVQSETAEEQADTEHILRFLARILPVDESAESVRWYFLGFLLKRGTYLLKMSQGEIISPESLASFVEIREELSSLIERAEKLVVQP